MMRAKLQVGIWLAALALGCVDDTPERFKRVEGGVCSSQSQPRCASPETILECVSRSWVELDCADVCADYGPSLLSQGCEAGGYRDWCACEPIDDSCGETSPTCESDTSITACTDGQLITTNCVDVCAGLDPPRVSDGCKEETWFAECSCTLAGTPCDSGSAPRCDALGAMAVCVDGVWVIDECRDGCSEDEYGYCKTALMGDELVAQCTCM